VKSRIRSGFAPGKKEAAMLYEKDIVTRARDRKSENLNWIERETELRQALGTGGPRKKTPRESKVRGAMEILKSLALLMKPGVGQGANR
jgi:hypothetical protein